MSSVAKDFKWRIQRCNDHRDYIIQTYGLKCIKSISRKQMECIDKDGHTQIWIYDYNGNGQFNKLLTFMYNAVVCAEKAKSELWEVYKELANAQEFEYNSGREFNATRAFYNWLDKE